MIMTHQSGVRFSVTLSLSSDFGSHRGCPLACAGLKQERAFGGGGKTSCGQKLAADGEFAVAQGGLTPTLRA